MPKTFPIRLEVEEIALGAVLRKLNDMPGIAKLHLDLERGGEGAGRKQLEEAASSQSSNNGSREQVVIKLLMQGPKHIREISEAVGGPKPRAYGLMNTLSRKGLAKSVGKGMHQLTPQAMAQLGGAVAAPAPQTLALPAPQVKHGPGGRASPGSGNIILRSVLHGGSMSPHDLRARLGENGMSPKSVSGVLDRARKHGLIKKNGVGYELTAKGHKIETGAHAHG